MRFKSLSVEQVDEAGKGLARIAQLGVVDHDGDTYAPGAFSWKEGGGQWVQILPAHDRRAMPLGKAWLYEKDGWALADFTLNLETHAGKDWYATLKFDLATGRPVQEWSYGYEVLDAVYEQRAGKQVQVLKKLDVDEISPVIRGAGVGTGTLSIKSAELKRGQFDALIAGLGELLLADKPGMLSATGMKQLADIHAALGKALTTGSKSEAALLAEDQAVQDAIGGYLEAVSRGRLQPSD